MSPKRPLGFRLPGSPRRIDREVEDEVRFHLEMRARELEHAGLSPGAARDEAERRFGDVAGARQELAAIDRRRLRGVRRADWWDGLLRDLRYAVRGFRREPGVVLAVTLTLGFGLGATSAMFGIVDRLLLRPPVHVMDPGTVGRIYYTEYFGWRGGPVTQASTSYPDFLLLRDHANALSGVAAYFPSSASLGRGPEARSVRRVAVSGGYFRLLGVQPEIGRFFGPEVDGPVADEPVAVISDAFWRREFGALPSVVARTMELDGITYSIIGVAPAGFVGVDLSPVDVWVPLGTVGPAAIGDGWADAAGWRWIRLIARLAPGYTAQQADAEATARYRAALEARGDPDSTARVTLGSVMAARGAQSRGSGVSEARISLWLAGVALLVLVIACANAANLLLARAVRRRKEIGVRVALGAGRGRLVRQLLVESLLLALLGGAVGLGLARWGGGLLRALLLPDVAWREDAFDPRVLAASGVLVALVAIATGLAPVVHALSQNVAGNLKEGARAGAGRRSRTRTALVLVQAALSVVLLVGAGLFVRSLRNVRGVELGFDANRVLLIELRASDLSDATRDALYHAARERVAALPVVERASIATTAPFWSAVSTDLAVPGLDSIPSSSDGGPYVTSVTADFFTTLGMPILRGRGFSAQDDLVSGRVAVVSQTMARLLWPGRDPLGECMIIGADTAPCSTVVGVAQDARRQSLIDDAPVLQYYVPLAQQQVDTDLRVLFVRTRGDPGAALAAVRREIQGVSADLPYPTVMYLARQIEGEVRPWKLGATLFGLFGALALALAALGLYSVVAYTVAQRRHEMGVRLALGARGSDVARLVVSGTLRVIGLGLVLGLVVALVAARWVESMLFRVSPWDPAVLTVVIGILLAVGTLASLVPAQRAARVAPAEVLKAE